MERLAKPQQGVLAGMMVGLVITCLALCSAAFVQIPWLLHERRLQLLVASSLLPALTLAFSISRLALHRFRTPQDLDGSGLTHGTDQAKLLQALLQNTLEQLALAIPVYAAWALLSPGRLLAAVPVAALLFFIGRALFFWGYHRGAPGRALGFCLTFYPTVLLLIGSVILVGVWACS